MVKLYLINLYKFQPFIFYIVCKKRSSPFKKESAFLMHKPADPETVSERAFLIYLKYI